MWTASAEEARIASRITAPADVYLSADESAKSGWFWQRDRSLHLHDFGDGALFFTTTEKSAWSIIGWNIVTQ